MKHDHLKIVLVQLPRFWHRYQTLPGARHLQGSPLWRGYCDRTKLVSDV